MGKIMRMTKSLYVYNHNNNPRVIGIAKVISFDKNGVLHETYGRVGQRSDNGKISKPKHIYDDWMTAQDELDQYADKNGLCWLKNNRTLPQIIFNDYTKEVRGCLFEGKLKMIDTSWRTRWKIITK